jgi:hypothetical protein
MTFFDAEKTLISDTECYKNFWSIGFRRVSDGKTLVMEHSRRRQIDRDRLVSLLRNNTIVGYNWQSYDAPMCAAVIDGQDNEQLKRTNDRIIVGGVKYWMVEQQLGLVVPRKWSFIDLIEPQPNAFASLKTLAGRMHAKKMQDLPYDPDTHLTEEEMDHVLSYMGNDLINTHSLFDELREALEMRALLSKEYETDFLSKSDSQIGEGIIKKRVEQVTGQRVNKVETPSGTSFQYKVPPYLAFESDQLHSILERVRGTEFYVTREGKVELPKWLSDANIIIGDTTYAMGIGGLHSTEKNRAVHADEEHFMRDYDVASYYPAIILGSGLYPKSLGPVFLDVYRKIRDDRIAAKQAGNKVVDQGMKIALNGVFGKLGSKYSILYAPHLLIAVTLTGQLSLLMLIERAERAGISVVSANTDGVVFRCPVDLEDTLKGITKQWEADTGFVLEDTEYSALYNQSVNTYIAVKPDGSAKLKGAIANPWRERDKNGRVKDKRGTLMKNPQATIVSDAVVDFITKGVPIEDTIRGCTDIRGFVTVVNVQGGGTWRGQYLGKVVRYIWGIDGEEIFYKKPDPRTGNFKKVPKSDGCIPMMDLPDEFPAHLIDYERYIQEARETLMDVGFDRRPDPIKPIRLYKWSAPLWFALAV